ncbi:efflux RND transporter permease subunit [Cellvibrio sp. NN19]|uniref:efflux RND transporter permease subunit n=1 Tax=Cellvibrio chitinivorans TaxID=3102792 RepID=UPI002B416769|nr:efflux RND transporter permease subunit [Cellvibrio sp. NN19]
MIKRLIRWSIAHRLLVLIASLLLTGWGAWAIKMTPIDALPDLSDVQVIIRTSFPGQIPQTVEDQVTYPITSKMMSVPGAKTVRGYSMFGDSFVYILFDDDTDIYWARSRVLEYLSQIQTQLPATAKPALGPDATGVGWIFQYALIDKTGKHDLAQLRALQDWFLRFELAPLPNVAEVAAIGGMVKQYQVILDPIRLASFNLSHEEVIKALQQANQETGGGVLVVGEAELMIRARGYLSTLDDFKNIPLRLVDGVPILLEDVATIQLGPEMRRGIAELNGEGEVTGGIVIMRSGGNARTTIKAVKEKLAQLKDSLPAGVEIVTTYDRSQLIDRAAANLTRKLIEEFLVVALVCAVFLWHWRSSLVAIVSLPLGVLIAFALMGHQGINANIMSLGGIAIAIGAMVDAAIVMIENAHKHLERWQQQNPQQTLSGEPRWQIITQAATEVGPALFFSLLIITLSFIPVFTLEAQEGRLFGPLAFTKTYAMAAAAGLSVTLIPVLMGYWIRGRIPNEHKNPLNRWLIAIYRPALTHVLRHPKTTLGFALAILLTTAWPLSQLGGEFLPPLDEGDVLYMPSALPGLTVQQASQLLQQTDRLIKTVPEVAQVFGKAGRSDSATDPAPLEMFETTIQFKPRDQWRDGMTPEKLIAELDVRVKIPGLSNIWIPPIRNRLDMLATGIKSPIGVKIAGNSLADIDQVAQQIEQVAKTVDGVSSAVAERIAGGRFLEIDFNREELARYGLSMTQAQSVVSRLIGGENLGEVIEGRARFPINLRYPRDWRDSIGKLRNLPIITPLGNHITLGTIANIAVSDGPSMLKSENARPVSTVYIDVRERDLAATVKDLQNTIDSQVKLVPGTSISYAGQFEFMERANARMQWIVPATLGIVLVLLFLTFSRWDEALLIMGTLPFALTGGVWLLYLMGYHLSVATAVGFIALAGVSAEFGVIMLLYLKQAWQERIDAGTTTQQDLFEAIQQGAASRIRPKMMTVTVIVAGLMPIFFGSGTGSEIMSRIAAPMVGGMISAPLLSLFVVPVLFRVLRAR